MLKVRRPKVITTTVYEEMTIQTQQELLDFIQAETEKAGVRGSMVRNNAIATIMTGVNGIAELNAYHNQTGPLIERAIKVLEQIKSAIEEGK